MDTPDSDTTETRGKKGKRRAHVTTPIENTIEPGRTRAPEEPPRRSGAPENEITSAARTRDERAPPVFAGEPPSEAGGGRRSAPADSQWGPESVPVEVRERYVRLERKYFLPSGDEAFRDHGAKLTTRSENIEIIRDLVKIAGVRYGEAINVSGSETFRRTVWQEAQLAKIAVRGYSPTREDEAQLVRTIARGTTAGREGAGPDARADSRAQEVANATAGAELARGRAEPATPQRERPIFGELLDHGREHFQFDRREDMSYFVKLRTEQGERILWGKDLERALSRSKTQPQIGDRIGVRHTGQETVTVIAHEQDAAGQVHDRAKKTHRNEWMLESEHFFQERARAADTVRDPGIHPDRATESHPQLIGTYLALSAAEKIATQRFANVDDRRRFMAMAREVIAQTVEGGDPLLSPKMREPQRASSRTVEPRAPAAEHARVPT